MSGASIEATLALWASSLRDVKGRIRPLFTQDRVAASAGLFLDGLVGDERRKTGWMRAEAAGDPGPWRQQAILGPRSLDADAPARHRARLCGRASGGRTCGAGARRDRIPEAGQGIVWRVPSVHGLGRQDHELPSGRVRRLCLLPRPRLYRPRALSAEDLDRRSGAPEGRPCVGRCWLRHQAQAGGPDDRARASRLMCRSPGSPPIPSMVVSEVERVLRRAGKGYVLGVTGDHLFHSWDKPQPVAGSALAIAEALQPSDWQRLSAGAGTKGPRLHDWAYLELADLEAEEFDAENPGVWTRGLLIRRHIANGDLAFFTLGVRPVRRSRRWCRSKAIAGAIEDSFETAKNELGLDHNESRSWHGWHRHVSLVMLAFAMMAAIRQRANATPPPKTKPSAAKPPRRP